MTPVRRVACRVAALVCGLAVVAASGSGAAAATPTTPNTPTSSHVLSVGPNFSTSATPNACAHCWKVVV